ncbi:MAG: hypothetical protein IPI00_03545 [Flavobacteriales bacterium]|nr:hypothetical protein [Flavobacteriales bacterium]MBK7297461.1 hypothetical protein [Flavobacteriales bacterium]
MQQIGGNWSETVNGVCEDANGNVYVTGALGGYNAPGGTIGGVLFPVLGTRDIFLAKFDASGNYVWGVTAGGEKVPEDVNEAEYGRNILYDSITNTIVLQGTYDSEDAYFGPGISAAGRGMFVAKYDLNGTCLWLQTVPWGIVYGMTIDDSGNIYAETARTVLFDDLLLVKYSPGGEVIWSKDIGYNIGDAWAADDNGTLIIAGACFENSNLLGTTFTPAASGWDALIARIDTSCTQVLATQQLGADSLALYHDLEILSNGALIITGAFINRLYVPNDTVVSIPDQLVRFLMKADSAGNPEWVETLPMVGTINSAALLSMSGESTF